MRYVLNPFAMILLPFLSRAYQESGYCVDDLVLENVPFTYTSSSRSGFTACISATHGLYVARWAAMMSKFRACRSAIDSVALNVVTPVPLAMNSGAQVPISGPTGG